MMMKEKYGPHLEFWVWRQSSNHSICLHSTETYTVSFMDIVRVPLNRSMAVYIRDPLVSPECEDLADLWVVQAWKWVDNRQIDD